MTGEPTTWVLTGDRADGGLFHDLQERDLYPRSSPLPWEPAPVWWEEGSVVDDDDYGSPFFLSYAHVTGGPAGTGEGLDPNGLAGRFFRDLADNVALLIPRRADVPAGFMDQRIRGGVRWTDELLHAVGTCQVLVALLSASYMRSEWCRMEWHAFSLREVSRIPGADASPRQGCIVPVIWAPLHSEPPEHVRLTQTFSPDPEPDPRADGHYKRNGVIGLMKVRRLNDYYEIVAWQLALHIADILYSQRTEHRKFEEKELRRVLEDRCHGS
jgi:TIR domain